MTKEIWLPIQVLPNFSSKASFENEFFAIVNSDDPRVIDIKDRLPNAARFLDSFFDQYQRKISVSLLIMNESSPEQVKSENAAIGFRNIVAMSHIIDSWESWVGYKSQFGQYKFSDYFDHYPIAVSKDGKYLIQQSPSVLGLDDYNKFRGQSSPALSLLNHLGNFDKEVYSLLHKQWRKAFASKRIGQWQYRVLFRSLEMAYQACSIPTANNSSIYDYGIGISLWVSAFEVLLHNKKDVSQRTVVEILEKIPFRSETNNKKRYSILWGKHRRRASILPKIGTEMYRARNAFLHGNPVKVNELFFLKDQNRQKLFALAPVVYKALLFFLYKIPPKKQSLKWLVQDHIVKNGLENALREATKVKSESDEDEP